jgi:hypothetical protein
MNKPGEQVQLKWLLTDQALVLMMAGLASLNKDSLLRSSRIHWVGLRLEEPEREPRGNPVFVNSVAA